MIPRLALAPLVASGVWRRLVDAGLVRGWHAAFADYWCRVLGHRPLEWPDFFHQMGALRHAAQEKPPTTWDDPLVEYLLFRHVYREAVQPLRPWRWARYLPRGGTVLDFGCGIGSVSLALLRYWPHKVASMWLHDLDTCLSRYARHRLTGVAWLPAVDQSPEFRPGEIVKVQFFNDHSAVLSAGWDTILCLETLEHLPNPLETLQRLTDWLRPGGILVLDFAYTEGDGLDSPLAEAQRPTILAWLDERFTVRWGGLPGVTVYRKVA